MIMSKALRHSKNSWLKYDPKSTSYSDASAVAIVVWRRSRSSMGLTNRYRLKLNYSTKDLLHQQARRMYFKQGTRPRIQLLAHSSVENVAMLFQSERTQPLLLWKKSCPMHEKGNVKVFLQYRHVIWPLCGKTAKKRLFLRFLTAHFK